MAMAHASHVDDSQSGRLVDKTRESCASSMMHPPALCKMQMQTPQSGSLHEPASRCPLSHPQEKANPTHFSGLSGSKHVPRGPKAMSGAVGAKVQQSFVPDSSADAMRTL